MNDLQINQATVNQIIKCKFNTPSRLDCHTTNFWTTGRGDSLRWPRDTLYPQKLALTSPTSGGRSVGIVHLRAKATEFSFSWY
jgi:hypothetical protein